MTQWETLELWMLEQFHEQDIDEETGTLRFIHEQLPFDNPSRAIQAYLEAQKPGGEKKKKTLFVIHRVPETRTRNAVWEAGTRAKHARSVGAQLGKDVQRRVERAIEPTLARIAEMNPRAARTTAALSKVIEGAVELLQTGAGDWSE